MRLTYDEFKQALFSSVKEKLGEDFIVKLGPQLGNNSVKTDRLEILKKLPSGHSVAPSFRLKELYEEYCDENRDIPSMTADILAEIKRIPSPEQLGIKSGFDKSKIFLTLINTEKNAERLQEIPSFPFHDLSVVFRVLTSREDNSIGSYLITNQLLQVWGISKAELNEFAIENTKRLFPTVAKSMTEMLELPEDFSMFPVPMYVLTNEQGVFCASQIVFRDVLESLADNHQSNLILLPSSIHECIYIPEAETDENMNFDELIQIVREINGNEEIMDKREILSDNIYYYDREKKTFTMEDGRRQSPVMY